MSRVQFDLLVRPLLTEKSNTLKEAANKVAFEVPLAANKIEIRRAVEKIYGVKVTEVNTNVVRGKWKRRGKKMGKQQNWKRAIVTLRAGDTIDFFAEEGA
ncbi:MAG TPA: 50S ribosomal protein L23 [Myxococcota bacterium]|jgi:large subunit ribosomal protein L23|nr:50S ribosomal protein L23 [Myxococcota bacterium]